jgi:hypothetical protein
MDKLLFLLEAGDPFAEDTREVLVAGRWKSLRQGSYSKADKILNRIELSDTASDAETFQRIQTELTTLISSRRNKVMVFYFPETDKRHVQVRVRFLKRSSDLKLTKGALDAVARFIISPFNDDNWTRHGLPMQAKTADRAILEEQAPPHVEQEELADQSTTTQHSFVLDKIHDVDAINDLRDDSTGKLDARKVAALFAIRRPAIAKAAGISPQALNENPLSPKAQHVLKLFERVARLRLHPQFKEPAKLRKWFRRSLPLFSGHSAEDLFKAGKLDVVATKVDEMLTGDFGG